MSEEDSMPNGWVQATIHDIAETIFGQSPPSSSYNKDGNGLPFFQGKAEFGKRHPVPRTWCTEATREAQPGDILISIRAPVGPTNVADRHCAIGRGLAAIRPFITPEYVRVWLLLSEQSLAAKGTGTTFSAISKGVLNSHGIPIAPLNEQRRIVERTEMLFAGLDKGEDTLRDVQKLLARYRQSVLKAAVTGQLTADWRSENAHRLEPGRDLLARILQARREAWDGRGQYKEPAAPEPKNLPELPEGWVWTTLENLGFVKSGQTPKGIEELLDPAGTIPWFKVSSMNEPGNEIEMRASRWMFSEDGAKAAGFNLLPTGTIVFPKRGGAILTNKKRRLGRRAALDLNTMGFVPVAIDSYVWAFFQGLDLRRIYDGSNIPQINYRDIADVPIAVPSGEEEATAISEIVSSSIEQTDRLESWCETELARSDALRRSILRDAFSGRLVPQDPDDETAADLLTRIKEARATGAGSSRRKTRK